eukprot:TRINITY_DN687259_c0_g1_i2.p1 TRINITY_DN687259_c0_g1~~TRINITY_DN687259_c0_g1_i2.p1  ORF type:complete len:342 (-),score=93.07 TRINITY_DN687259_c0_g1_i2:303-1307(-)
MFGGSVRAFARSFSTKAKLASEALKVSNSQAKTSFGKSVLKASMGLLGAGAVIGAPTLLFSEFELPEKFPMRDEIENLRMRAQPLKNRFMEMFDFFVEPASDDLLPDFAGNFPMRTLVIALEDNLLHEEWTHEHGIIWLKRPGVEQFLQKMCQYYELVLFSNKGFGAVEGCVGKLDPYGFFQHRLFRDSTLYKKGRHIKDLSRLNRELNKVIMLEVNPADCMQNENVLTLSKYEGDRMDNELFEIEAFLESLVMENVDDVREALKQYAPPRGKTFGEHFAEMQKVKRVQQVQSKSHGLVGALQKVAGAVASTTEVQAPASTPKSKRNRRRSVRD